MEGLCVMTAAGPAGGRPQHPGALLQKPSRAPASPHQILTGAPAPPETSGMLLCSTDGILGALNMSKLPDMSLFCLFVCFLFFFL